VSKGDAWLPAPRGWSATMKRWLASSTERLEPAIRWTAPIDDGHGPCQICLDEIRAVGVEDLAQIVEHRIDRLPGRTVHWLRFVGGGELRYAVDGRGQVVTLCATGIRGSVSPGRILTFGAWRPERALR
jgi:hypothetical protein